MAVLNKAWGTLNEVPAVAKAVVTGEGEEAEEAAEQKLLDKPLFIYVTDGADLGVTDKIEKVVLMDDKVCVGMWAFDCVKMTPERVAEDKLLSKEWNSGETRGFIFVSRDLATVDVVDMRKMSAKNVFKTMTKHAQNAYKTEFEKNIKEVIKVLGEFDKLNNARRVLADKETRASEKGDKDALKGIKQDREELDATEKEMNKKRDSLLKFELKALRG